MTVKQKAARAKFKMAIAETKKLRAKNPKLSQAQALKQAFAILYGKKVGPVKKKAAVKKAAPKKKAAVKKAAPKKKAAVKKLKSYHKDTKSHNVNIRVVSGIGKMNNEFITSLKEANDRLIKYQNVLLVLMDEKNSKTILPLRKKTIAFDIKTVKNVIKEQKIHIRELKKNIK